LICEQIKDELLSREQENQNILEGQIEEYKDSVERKEYQL
jgi:hypothetical protein